MVRHAITLESLRNWTRFCHQQQFLWHLVCAVLGVTEGTCLAFIGGAGFGEVAILDIAGPGVGAEAGGCDARQRIIVKATAREKS
jgi:hypothetical protein